MVKDTTTIHIHSIGIIRSDCGSKLHGTVSLQTEENSKQRLNKTLHQPILPVWYRRPRPPYHEGKTTLKEYKTNLKRRSHALLVLWYVHL